MKKVLILEDNPVMLEHLSNIVKETKTKACVFSFDNLKDAYQCVMERRIDLFIVDIILDVSLPGDSSGLRFIENVRQINHYAFTPVIVVTSLQDPKLYAYENLHCYGFIEKPFDNKQVSLLVEQALGFPGVTQSKTLYFQKEGVTLAVECEDIVYVESVNHVLSIYTRQNDVMHIPYITIKKLLEDADSPDFIQCSRSTIVNRRYINNVDFSNRIIHLKDGMGRVDIGVTFKNSLKEMFR
ncbi:MAG: response regulator transcription factor [Lachnospiraceae bacterium]|nr:response regulator transcription factor [Lachnospiraceae bacterium]